MSDTAAALQAIASTVNPSASAQELEVEKDGKRRNVVSSSTMPRRQVDKDTKGFDFKNPKQQWALVHLAHQEQQCVSKVAQMIIMGLFPTKERADRHAASLQSKMDSYTIPTHTWFRITKKPTPPEEAQSLQDGIKEQVEGFLSSLKDEEEQVVAEADDDKAEERYNAAKERWDKNEALQNALDDAEKSQETDGTFTPVISRDQEVRNQRHAVISIISKPDLDDEPLINILAAFDDRGDARDYLRNTCLVEQVSTLCFSVNMYEWLMPVQIHTQNFFDKVEGHYTHKQLEEIHGGHRAEKKKIENILAARGLTQEDVDKEMEKRFNEQQQKQEEEEVEVEEEDNDE